MNQKASRREPQETVPLGDGNPTINSGRPPLVTAGVNLSYVSSAEENVESVTEEKDESGG
jgi:hypothetical protein